MANPQRALDKWKRNAASNQTSMKDGINDVQVSPGEGAIAAKEKYIRKVNESYNDGSYEAGLRSFTLQDWKQAMLTKGIANQATGVANLSPRSAANIVAAQNHANAIKAATAAMPNNSKSDALQKVAKAMDMWEEFKKQKGR